jgi:hypothetical protein
MTVGMCNETGCLSVLTFGFQSPGKLMFRSRERVPNSAVSSSYVINKIGTKDLVLQFIFIKVWLSH